jgi:UDP-N-acetyl-D-glucosamine/UDP-N-acetyl-D-galactosamine dehydrogenase
MSSLDPYALLLTTTTQTLELRDADCVLVAVPSPVDTAHFPDFGPLRQASRPIGENLKPGAVVVFDSTVYPGEPKRSACRCSSRRQGGKKV